MCESTLYLETRNGKKKIAEEVMSIEVEGNKIVAKDILGKAVEVRGRIKSINLSGHEVIVVETE